MNFKAQHFAGLMIAFVTLVIGVGFVFAINALWAERRKETPKVPTYPVSTPKAEPPAARQELSCYDMSLMPVWNVLKQDGEFSERIADSGGNCSDMLEIERVDLNRDGKKEILVRGKNFHLCGATGNCGFWVLEETRTRPRIILSGTDYADVSELGEQVLKTRANGYADILLKGQFSAAGTAYRTYKFEGATYVEKRCMFEVPNYDRQRESFETKMITCEEFAQRANN